MGNGTGVYTNTLKACKVLFSARIKSIGKRGGGCEGTLETQFLQYNQAITTSQPSFRQRPSTLTIKNLVFPTIIAHVMFLGHWDLLVLSNKTATPATPLSPPPPSPIPPIRTPDGAPGAVIAQDLHVHRHRGS